MYHKIDIIKTFSIILLCYLIYSCSFNKPPEPDLAAEIFITYNSIEINPGQNLQLPIYSGNPADISFLIENKGEGPLDIKNPVFISDSKIFQIVKEPASSISPGKQTEFILKYSSNNNLDTADIMIKNNDPEKDDFSFNIVCKKSKIRIYFTGPDYDSSLESALVDKIKNQTVSEYLDLCLYGLDKDLIIREIESAIARGVHVRFVGNLDGNESLETLNGTYYEGYYRIADALDTYFPVAGKKRIKFPEDNDFNDFILRNNNIMHNKFALFTDNDYKYILTGSTNFTNSGFNLNNNNSIMICDSNVYKTYHEQFEYLLGLPGKEPVNEIRKHVIDDIPVEAMFAPSLIEGKTPIEQLMQRIASAETNIHFMIFSLTHRDLINQFIDKFKSNLIVKGLFDESQMYYSSEELLSMNGIPCRSDGNYNEIDYHGGKLHHKTMILDDETVITGSFNWSYNANNNNDENIIFIHSNDIARLYKNEWQKRWNEGKDIIQAINSGNNQTEYDYGNYQDILINEVMWMGSRRTAESTVSNDEFIELKNRTNRRINLSGWYLEGAARSGKILFLENISIEPNSLIVIMHRVKTESAFIPDNCFEISSLSISNSNLEIILKDPNNTIIDHAGSGIPAEDFSGYSDVLKKSMARKDPTGDGTAPDNWFTTDTQINISGDHSYLSYNLATPGAENDSGDSGWNPLEIVISEIAWAGTDISHYDEWLEFYNNSENDINLAGWSIQGSLNVQLYGIIPANTHFLLERTNDDSVPGKTADMIYAGGLNNNGALIRLVYNNRDIDYIDTQAGWPAGSNDPKISMERINNLAPGENSNWQDGPGDIEGAQNAVE